MINLLLRLGNTSLQYPDQIQAQLEQVVAQEMRGILEEQAQQARDAAPVGATGNLRDSLSTRLTLATDAAHFAQGEVVADVPYAAYVANGTEPHWPPREPIEAWAAAKLGNGKLWFVIARAIARRGTRANEAFKRAFQVDGVKVARRIQAVVDALARKLNG